MNWKEKYEFTLILPGWAWRVLFFLLFLSAYGQIRTVIVHWNDDKEEMISKALETEEGREALAEMFIE